MEQELQFLLYDLPDDSAKVQVVVRDETVWMTQKAMGVLFGVQAPAISKHLKNIFESGELNPEVVISKMETTTQHGAIAGKTQTQLFGKNLNRKTTKKTRCTKTTSKTVFLVSPKLPILTKKIENYKDYRFLKVTIASSCFLA